MLAVCDRPPRRPEVERPEATPAVPVDRALHSAANADKAPKELQYFDTLLAILERSVDTAQMAPTRTMHTVLRSDVSGIVSERQELIASLKTFRGTNWGEAPGAANFELEDAADVLEKSDLGRLELLKADEFDREFMRQFASLDEAAKRLVRSLRSAQPQNEDLLRLLQKIETTIDLENDRLRSRPVPGK